MKILPFPIILFACFWVCPAVCQQAQIAVYGYRVVQVFPHDTNAFTQGLEFRNGSLYEGTGLNGRSTLRREDLQSGRVLQEISVSDRYFGEGITVLPKKIVQLTWREHTAFLYDRSSFQLIRTFRYEGEGWGLTNDGQRIYMSDGTAQIRILDSESLTEQRRITVHAGGHDFPELNELEFVRGEIYANVWQTDQILRISPKDGTVVGVIELGGLLSQTERESGADVLNGIAYDADRDRLFVTGKLWPKLFEIKLEPRPSSTLQ